MVDKRIEEEVKIYEEKMKKIKEREKIENQIIAIVRCIDMQRECKLKSEVYGQVVAMYQVKLENNEEAENFKKLFNNFDYILDGDKIRIYCNTAKQIVDFEKILKDYARASA
jgi:hypothetical protein